jgi:hypothetical protein
MLVASDLLVQLRYNYRFRELNTATSYPFFEGSFELDIWISGSLLKLAL